MKKNKSYEEEEYKFDETTEHEGSSSEFGTFMEEEPTPKPGGGIARIVLVLFCFVIIVLALWQIFQLFAPLKAGKNYAQSLAEKSIQSLEQAKEKPVVPLNKSPVLMDSKPKVVEQPVDIAQINSSSADKAYLQSLSESLQKVNQMVSQQAGDISTAQGRLAQIDDRFDKLTMQLSEVSSQLNQLQQKLIDLKTMSAKASKDQKSVNRPKVHSKKVKKIQPEVYYIKAILPGRAWLMTKNGTSMTVAVGFTLAGYGTITGVDAYHGLVTTSSGRVIHLSPEDS